MLQKRNFVYPTGEEEEKGNWIKRSGKKKSGHPLENQWRDLGLKKQWYENMDFRRIMLPSRGGSVIMRASPQSKS